jgi:hypothetical protein
MKLTLELQVCREASELSHVEAIVGDKRESPGHCELKGAKVKNIEIVKHRKSPQTSAARRFLREMPGEYPGSEAASSPTPVAAVSASPALKIG